MLDKLKSRKFLSMIGAVLISLGSIATGQMDAQTGILAAVGAIIAYIAAEGFADGQGGDKPA